MAPTLANFALSPLEGFEEWSRGNMGFQGLWLSTREWGTDPCGPPLCGGCPAWRYTSKAGRRAEGQGYILSSDPSELWGWSCPKSGHYQDLSRVSFEECMFAKSLQSYLTLCDPMDCSPPGSSVQGILPARTLERVDITFSRGSFWPREWTLVSHIAGRFFTVWATRKE